LENLLRFRENHRRDASDSIPEGLKPVDSNGELPVDELQNELIKRLRQIGALSSAAVVGAFAAVPRHLFLPGLEVTDVYADQVIITKAQRGTAISSSSRPAVMAVMLEQLELEQGQRVLEIGAGTGYNAAMIRHIVGPHGRVTTVDIDVDLVSAARAHLSVAGYSDVTVIRSDGSTGWVADAPYDRIIATVGASDIPRYWIEQLRPGGLLLAPVRLGLRQYGMALRKQSDGTLTSTSIALYDFMPMRGRTAVEDRTITVDEWGVTVEGNSRFDESQIASILSQPIGMQHLTNFDPGLLLYLAFRSLPLLQLWHRVGTGSPRWAMGYFDPDAMSGYILEPQVHAGMIVRLYGSRAAFDHLIVLLRDWAAAGRPTLDQLQLHVVPTDGHKPSANPLTLVMPSVTFLLNRDRDRSGGESLR